MIGFDSSALLAYVRDEPGADLVGGLLDDADVEMFVHGANLCEMFHGLLRYEGRVTKGALSPKSRCAISSVLACRCVMIWTKRFGAMRRN